jgi:hypothetical protein
VQGCSSRECRTRPEMLLLLNTGILFMPLSLGQRREAWRCISHVRSDCFDHPKVCTLSLICSLLEHGPTAFIDQVSGWHSLKALAMHQGATLSPRYLFQLVNKQGVSSDFDSYFLVTALNFPSSSHSLWSSRSILCRVSSFVLRGEAIMNRIH